MIGWADYADVDGKNKTAIGELDTLPEKGLLKTLFGGESEIKSLSASLQEKSLPQGWGQGKVRGYVNITKNNIVFGVFNVLEEGMKFEDLQRKTIFLDEIRNILEKSV